MSRLKAHLATLSGAASNLTSGRAAEVLYVVDKENWAVRAVGSSIARNLADQLPVHLSTTALGARKKLLHFGSIDMYITSTGWRHVHDSNRVIVTVFHLSPIYRQTHLLAPALADTIVHTTNSLTRAQLIELGIPTDNIRVIPLGVDFDCFRQAPNQRETVRRRYNIDPRAFVIGSFQKDGVGWGEGLEPKLIKGPDTFVETVTQLARELPIHILLSGPARGYVIEQLKARNIPYTYAGYQSNTQNLPALYRALDLYLITSRVEGGPLQILEAWSAGVPLVATPVGMIPDIAESNHNCLIAPIEDAGKLAEAASALLRNKDIADRLRHQAQQDASEFDWSVIADRYLAELYQAHLVRV